MVGLSNRPPRRRASRTTGALIGAGMLVVSQLGGVSAAAPASAAPPASAAAPASPSMLVVQADQPSAVPAYHNWGFDDFFPRALTVAQGSTIGFAIEGFHTATLLPVATTVAQDNATAGVAAPDAEDTTPNPNGTTHLNESIAGLTPLPATGCGAPTDPCTFDGTAIVSAGAPLSGPPSGPYAVTITAPPGKYVFHCRIHSQMEGTLDVVAQGGTSTTADELNAAVQTQIAADVAAGTTAEAAANTAGHTVNADGSVTWTLSAGTSSPDGHTVILEMLPVSVAIAPGDTVVWKAPGHNEVHTVTFPGELHSDAVPMCENGAVDVPAVPKVNPPQGPFDFACGSAPPDEIEFGGGNGVTTITDPTTVADSGLMANDGEAAAFGAPATAALTSWSASFTGAAPGLYTYVCQIHNNMQGTILIPGPRPTS